MSKFDRITGKGSPESITDEALAEACLSGMPTDRKNLSRLYAAMVFITGQFVNEQGEPKDGVDLFTRSHNGEAKPTTFSGADAALAISDILRGLRDPQRVMHAPKQNEAGLIAGIEVTNLPFSIRPDRDEPFLAGMAPILSQSIDSKSLVKPKIDLTLHTFRDILPYAISPVEVARNEETERALFGSSMFSLVEHFPELASLPSAVVDSNLLGLVITDRINNADTVSTVTYDLSSFGQGPL